MKLVPREVEKLALHRVGFLAQKRLTSGLCLNYVEAATLIATQLVRHIAVEDVKCEVKILQALKGHENIVHFHNAFEDDDDVYIVMDESVVWFLQDLDREQDADESMLVDLVLDLALKEIYLMLVSKRNQLVDLVLDLALKEIYLMLVSKRNQLGSLLKKRMKDESGNMSKVEFMEAILRHLKLQCSLGSNINNEEMLDLQQKQLEMAVMGVGVYCICFLKWMKDDPGSYSIRVDREVIIAT
ncbi:uncharacterized protein A4U43_C08F17560 [Asparagus officinalis]|nr:uncharacterized protein A4U43_C08F17560 [Asparagus officinalis]